MAIMVVASRGRCPDAPTPERRPCRRRSAPFEHRSHHVVIPAKAGTQAGRWLEAQPTIEFSHGSLDPLKLYVSRLAIRVVHKLASVPAFAGMTC